MKTLQGIAVGVIVGCCWFAVCASAGCLLERVMPFPVKDPWALVASGRDGNDSAPEILGFVEDIEVETDDLCSGP